MKEYLRIKVINPDNFEIGGILVHKIPEVKRYNGTFQLTKVGILSPVANTRNVEFIPAHVECSPENRIYQSLINNKPFFLTETKTNKGLAVVRLVNQIAEPNLIERLTESEEAKLLFLLGAKLGKYAYHLVK